MLERDAYLETIAAQLTTWKAAIDKMQLKVSQMQPIDKRQACETQLETVVHQHQALERKLEDMRLAGPETWDTLRAEMEQLFAGLQEMLACFETHAERQEFENLTWAKGLAAEHLVESIGWAEGLAEEDPVESIGWAEGQAEEDPVESIGWAQGYHTR